MNYHLGSHDEAGVQPAHTLSLTNATAEWDPQLQQFRAAYAVALPNGAAAALLPYPVIYAGVSCPHFPAWNVSICPAPLRWDEELSTAPCSSSHVSKRSTLSYVSSQSVSVCLQTT